MTFTYHAKERMEEREISADRIINAVKHGDKRYSCKTKVRYFRRIIHTLSDLVVITNDTMDTVISTWEPY